MVEPDCAKCGAPMSEGFIVDHAQIRRVKTWIEGLPETSLWGTGVKVKDTTAFTVRTFRCTKCGYLESYTGDRTFY